MTDAFKTTQILENGTLEVSCEATGYIVKDEAVCTAEVTGEMSYLLNDGTVVKKGTKIAEIEPADKEKQAKSKIKGKYEDYLSRLKNYDMLYIHELEKILQQHHISDSNTPLPYKVLIKDK